MTILTFRGPLGAAGSALGTGKSNAADGIISYRRAIAGWIGRFRQRRALYEIAERNDDHLLKDIGVSRQEAFREAEKPFWRS